MNIKKVKEGFFNIAICCVYLKEYEEAQKNLNEYIK
jgi:hypothetical protein